MTHHLPQIQYEGKVGLYDTNLYIFFCNWELRNPSPFPSCLSLQPKTISTDSGGVSYGWSVFSVGPYGFFQKFFCAVVRSVETFKNL